MPFRFSNDNAVSIYADDTTNNSVINIHGFAPAGKTVKVYDGVVLIGTFTATNGCRYFGEVTLSGGYGTHTLRAETVNQFNEKISAEAIIMYEELAPRLAEFYGHPRKPHFANVE